MRLTYDEYKKYADKNLKEWQVKNDYDLIMLSVSGSVTEIENKNLYNRVIRELMIYCLQKKYIHSIYKSVLSELIHNWQNRQFVKFYKRLIS